MRKPITFISTVVIVLAVIFAVFRIAELSRRIERIERKLGGPRRIACNEKESVEKVRRSVVRVVCGESEGSGFAIQKGGYILTNFHVVDAEPAPKVILPDNRFETAKVIIADKDADLAVIKIASDLPVVSFVRLSTLYPVEEVLAIGYPLGGGLSGDSFVVRGAFSRYAKDKKNGMQYILTDITFVSGISGGPMINVCGEVVGINTSGLLLGGMGIAISTDSILEKCRQMLAAKEPLKDVQKVNFEPEKNPLESVRCFYNYLKARKLEKAFELLSDNFVAGYSFEQWAWGYRPLLDTTMVMIKPDKDVEHRIHVKLSTKDLVGDEIVYKYFQGYWDVRRIGGKWLLFDPEIREVEDPDKEWFLDQELIGEIEEFVKGHPEAKECMYDMYAIAQEPGNEGASLPELYRKAREQAQEGKKAR
jgi:hypothetical protein